ncbi:hypothetical protein [Paracoccus aminovorans]|uniref:hypothetical protein n=1 Tax=Paracoccus aminovorans TaxID=34004 RepID=UPI0012E356AC|nr:hypothetical protein [Paracoccus aminovorans]
MDSKPHDQPDPPADPPSDMAKRVAELQKLAKNLGFSGPSDWENEKRFFDQEWGED